MTEMMKLYHMPASRSTRVIWTLEELKLPYELVTKEREALKKPDYLAIHPLGAVPLLIDGGLSLFESGAIVEYLVERHDDGRLAPGLKEPSRPKYLQWFHFAEASLMPPMSQYIIAAGLFGGAQRNEQGVAIAQSRLSPALKIVEDTLGRSPYIAGDRFTAADIMIGWNLFIARRFEMIGEYKNINAYLGRLLERPTCAKAMAV